MARPRYKEDYREAVRQGILEAALELFSEHGYEQVSIRNIAAKVGYSPGAIYGYFASKDDIFFALAEKGLTILSERGLGHEPSADPMADLRITAQEFLEFSKEYPNLFALIYLDRRVPRIAHEFGRLPLLREIWAGLEGRVQRCIDAGIFPSSVKPKRAIRLLMSPMMGIAVHHISNRLGDDEDLDALVTDMIDVTIAGLQAGDRQLSGAARQSSGADREQ